MHPRLSLGLTLLALLSACQSPTANGNKGPGAGLAPAAKPSNPAIADAKATPTASPAPAIAEGAASAARLGVPARVHVPVPPNLLLGSVGTILGADASALLSNEQLGLIANDGAALIANDGSSLIANDGSSLIANDGSSLIANDGSSYRLQQEGPQGPSPAQVTDLLLQLSAVAPTPRNLMDACILFYGTQATYVTRCLETIGRQRMVSGQPKGFMMRLPLPGGSTEVVLANVLSLPSAGPKPHPILWLYNLKGHTDAGSAFPATPFVAIEITGPGQGRALWRPDLGEAGFRHQLGFATRFNLPQEEASAELAMIGEKGEMRRLAWDFQRPAASSGLRFRGACAVLFEQASNPVHDSFRRIAMDVDLGGQSRAGMQLAPVGTGLWPASSAFRWLVDDAGALGTAPTFFGIDPQGEHGPVDRGPSPADAAGFGGFSTRSGALQVQRPSGPVLDDPAFAWPGPLPEVGRLKADITPEIQAYVDSETARLTGEQAASAAKP